MHSLENLRTSCNLEHMIGAGSAHYSTTIYMYRRFKFNYLIESHKLLSARCHNNVTYVQRWNIIIMSIIGEFDTF